MRVRLISSPATAYFQGRSLVSVQATDATGKLRLKWFNQPYRRGQLQPGDTYVACGRVDARRGLSMLNPSLYRELPGLLPVYPLVQGLTQRFLRAAVAQALPSAAEIFDPFPPALRAENGLCPRAYAFVQAHRPDGPEALQLARRTLAFEDLLCYLLAVELQKQERRRFTGISFLAEGARKRYLGKLPFTPTEAQLRVMDEIERDMAAPFTMNRLLQGDVGSGKTAVALYALYIAVENGYQGVLMAPTEILARQHYDSLLGIFGSSACLLHGACRNHSARRRLPASKMGKRARSLARMRFCRRMCALQNWALS